MESLDKLEELAIRVRVTLRTRRAKSIKKQSLADDQYPGRCVAAKGDGATKATNLRSTREGKQGARLKSRLQIQIAGGF